MISIDKILLINLDKRKDRLNRFHNEVKKSKILSNKYERVSAIDGSLLHNNDIKKYVTDKSYEHIISNKKSHGLHMTRGAVGLAATYKKIFDECAENILLLEDDIIIHDMYDELFLKSLADLPSDWDILYIGWYNSAHLKITKISDNISSISGQINGTQGWVINPTSAKKLQSMFPLSYQIDTEIYSAKNLNKYCSNTKLINRYNSHSDIQN